MPDLGQPYFLSDEDKDQLDQLRRYYSWLQSLYQAEVVRGRVSQKEADQLLAYWDKALGVRLRRGGKQAIVPSWDDIIAQYEEPPFWNKLKTPETARAFVIDEQKAAYEAATKVAIAEQNYFPALENYLVDAVGRHSISAYQSKEIIDTEKQLIRWGTDVKNLPNYQNVQQFFEIQQGEKERAFEEKRQRVVGEFQAKEQAKAMAGGPDWAAIGSGDFSTWQGGQLVTAGYSGLMEQEKNRQLWENWKQQTLIDLSGPGDWIKRWRLEHTENPYASQWERDYIAKERTLHGTAFNLEEQGKVAAYWESLRAPPPDEWMLSFAPGQQMGKAVKPLGLPTPSGQQLSTLTPSMEMKLAGLAEYGGQDWGDILSTVQKMSPRTPSVRTSWGTTKQRTLR